MKETKNLALAVFLFVTTLVVVGVGKSLMGYLDALAEAVR